MPRAGMSIEEAIEQHDPDGADYDIAIMPDGWYAVPKGLPQWMAWQPEAGRQPMHAGGDPCD